MIHFNQDKPIFLQIADRICDEILSGKYADDQRIPSVRDYSALLQVNTNTAVRAYDELSRAGIIYQRRGMGYFVTAGARNTIREQRRKAFVNVTLREFFREMDLLEIGMDVVIKRYDDYHTGISDSDATTS